MDITPVGYIHTDFSEKFGVPRQSGIAPHTQARIEFAPGFDDPDCLREIDGFSHLWLIWRFSENEDAPWQALVRPPRLGGIRRVGVFASRSPFRPNMLGLSLVRLERVELDAGGAAGGATPGYYGPALYVSGADLVDGTPIIDIKPYLPESEALPDACGGYSGSVPFHLLEVDAAPELLAPIPEEKRAGLLEVLAQDPRPAYHDDPERVYGFGFAGHDVRFRVDGDTLHLVEVRDGLYAGEDG